MDTLHEDTRNARSPRRTKEVVCACCGARRTVRADSIAKVCTACFKATAKTRKSKPRTGHYISCIYCGKPAWAKPSRERFYCSFACRDADKTKHPLEKRKCAHCGAEFFYRQQKSNSKGIYCSLACRTADSKNFYRGRRITVRSKARRGWKWTQHKHVQRNDICVVCGTRDNLEVHHIVPRRITDDNSDMNLLTLCHRHHVALQRYSDLLANCPEAVREAQRYKLQVILEERWLIFKGRELMEQECS